jgi:multiple sugar transport system ATP-binding protein
MAGVILENVSRVYTGGVVAVNRVSLEVFDREFLVLVGPSGCGKTTALRMIAGLEELSEGTIRIGSRIVNDVPPKDRDIAMVFQNYALYPHMTVYRNLAFGLELREGVNGWGWLWRWALPSGRKAQLAARRFAIAERVHQAARTLGIEDLLERLPRQLSGGQRQRVALGRAIVRSPEVFLFDEPLSNLDAKLRVEMRRELKQLHGQLQATMIYVTHDQVEALTLGQRIVVMDEGSIQQAGTPTEVYDWPANRFVAGFIGTPAMNFIEGELTSTQSAGRAWQTRGGGWSVSLSERPLEQGLKIPRPATLGVRPEDVSIVGDSAADGATTQAVVRVVEMLGDATVATLELPAAGAYDQETDAPHATSDRQHQNGPTYVVTKLDSRSGPSVGDRVAIRVDPRRVHVFDPASGRNWVRQESKGAN